MPLIADDFFQSVRLVAGGVSKIPREAGFLFSSFKDIRRLLDVEPERWDLRFRLSICRDLARILDLLHRSEIVFGDLSSRNVLFSAAFSPRVFLIDCDEARIAGSSLPLQAHTPGWEPPKTFQPASRGSNLQNYRTDRYKLALFVLRSLSPGRGASLSKDWRPIEDKLDPAGVRLVRTSLSPDSLGMVSAREWMTYLDTILAGPLVSGRKAASPEKIRAEGPPKSNGLILARYLDGEFPLGRVADESTGKLHRLGFSQRLMRENVTVIGPPASGKSLLIGSWIEPALRSGFSVVYLGIKPPILDGSRIPSPMVEEWATPELRTLDGKRLEFSIHLNWLRSAKNEDHISGVVDAILGRDDDAPGSDLHRLQRFALTELIRLPPSAFHERDEPANLVKALAKQHSLISAIRGREESFPTLRMLSRVAERDYDQLTVTMRRLLANVSLGTGTWTSTDLYSDLNGAPPAQALVTVPLSPASDDRSVAVACLYLNELIRSRSGLEGPARGRPIIVIIDDGLRIFRRLAPARLLSLNRTSGVSAVISAQTAPHLSAAVSPFDVFRNAGVIIGTGIQGLRTVEGISQMLDTDSSRSGTREPAPWPAYIADKTSIANAWGAQSGWPALVFVSRPDNSLFLVDME